MKSFENIDAKSVKEAVGLLQKFNQQKKLAAVVGGAYLAYLLLVGRTAAGGPKARA